MKAAVLYEIGNPLRIEEVPTPKIGPDEVLVETRSCGICRTDLHVYDGLAYIPELPHIPGHEPAGVVADVGKNVTGLGGGTTRRAPPFYHVRGVLLLPCWSGRPVRRLARADRCAG